MITATLSATSIAFSSIATAQTCTERCDSAYRACAAIEAAGCEIGGQLVGEAAEQLGNEVPIPGMGALFGALARGTMVQNCAQLLGPCKQILTNCLSECASGDESAEDAAAAAPETRYSTLRIFADQPRTIVYINEQRMGATPEDVLEPFVSPEMRVGRYWVRLASLDGEWEWRGEKTVKEGNINAVEGNLANRRLGLLGKARDLYDAGETVRAAGAYRELLAAFPNDVDIGPEARARLKDLFPAFKAADIEMFRRIETETILQKRAILCRVYLEEFAGGAFRAKVQAALTEIEKALPRSRRPGEPAEPVDDDRAQVEAVIGKDLSTQYATWQHIGTEPPKFSDYMFNHYEQRRRSAIGISITFGTIGVAGLVVGPVLLAKADREENENLTIAGAIVTGEAVVILVATLIAGPVVGVRAKKNKQKLESMKETTIQSSGPQFVGFSPLVADVNAPRGLSLNWEY